MRGVTTAPPATAVSEILTLFRDVGYIGAAAETRPAALKPVPLTTKTDPCAMLFVYAAPSSTAVIAGWAMAAVVHDASKARMRFMFSLTVRAGRSFRIPCDC